MEERRKCRRDSKCRFEKRKRSNKAKPAWGGGKKQRGVFPRIKTKEGRGVLGKKPRPAGEEAGKNRRVEWPGAESFGLKARPRRGQTKGGGPVSGEATSKGVAGKRGFVGKPRAKKKAQSAGRPTKKQSLSPQKAKSLSGEGEWVAARWCEQKRKPARGDAQKATRETVQAKKKKKKSSQQSYCTAKVSETKHSGP